jgi:hypothetical protein
MVPGGVAVVDCDDVPFAAVADDVPCAAVVDDVPCAAAVAPGRTTRRMAEAILVLGPLSMSMVVAAAAGMASLRSRYISAFEPASPSRLRIIAVMFATVYGGKMSWTSMDETLVYWVERGNLDAKTEWPS